MTRINWGSVLTGGLLAGLVVNLSEFHVNGVLLAPAWEAARKAFPRSPAVPAVEVLLFNLWGFLMGVAAVWLYRELRDRYGAGVHTAIRAGLALWLIAYLGAALPGIGMGIFPEYLMLIGCGAGLAEILVAAVLGGWVYRPAAAA